MEVDYLFVKIRKKASCLFFFSENIGGNLKNNVFFSGKNGLYFLFV